MDLGKFRGIWRSLEGSGEVSRDLEEFRGIWRSFGGYGEVSRDFQKFRGIWRGFAGRQKGRGIGRQSQAQAETAMVYVSLRSLPSSLELLFVVKFLNKSIAKEYIEDESYLKSLI